MSSLSVALPLRYSTTDGYEMHKTIRNMLKQNLKMLVMTNPGERVMEPTFGVGLQGYLFENFTSSTYAEINEKIKQQAKLYIPVIKILRVSFNDADIDRNTLGISIVYAIPKIGMKDLLEFTI